MVAFGESGLLVTLRRQWWPRWTSFQKGGRRFSGQRVHSWVCQKAWLLSKSFCKDSSLSGILMTCLTNWPPVFTNRSGLLDESATARPGADRIVGHFHLGKSCAMKVASLPLGRSPGRCCRAQNGLPQPVHPSPRSGRATSVLVRSCQPVREVPCSA